MPREGQVLMSDPLATAEDPRRTSVVKDFAASELFDRTFQEGMDLVEETAAYLDGGGRQESKQLPRRAALAYASESMRLTTRLMQLASWLLVQRAVREGQMAASEACQDRYRLTEDLFRPPASDQVDQLPAGLLKLLDRACRLYERVLHLDRRMYLDPSSDAENHPVLSQMDRLQAAFGRSG
jgi:regulator of CtrA degradation